MAVNTATITNNTTLTGAAHIQVVMKQLNIEMGFIKNSYRSANYSFDVGQSSLDVSILALNSVITGCAIQYHRDGVLVLEHRYDLSGEPIEAWGVAADQVPLANIPAGLSARFVVWRNPNQSEAFVDEWLSRLGYTSCHSLRIPDGAVTNIYGTFESGGWGLTRTQIIDPQFVSQDGHSRPDLAMKEANH